MTRGGARGRAVMVLAAAILFAASPLVVGGFGGFDPAAFPVPQQDPPVQPAGWAFSIWGLIYLWLLAHAGYGLLRRAGDAGWDRTRLPMLAALGLGAAWIPVARQSPVTATVVIALMLAAAVLALLRAPRADRMLAGAPIGVFAGWLTAATAASLGLVLAGWGLTGPITAAVAALAWALGLSAAVLAFRAELAYALGVAWALVGIVAANGLSQPLVSAIAAAGGIALIWLALHRGRTLRGERP